MKGDINKRIVKLKTILDEKALAKYAYTFFKDFTPVNTGFAKSKTSYRANEIRAEYSYATRLNQGWSDQAKKGMSAPTIVEVKKYIKQVKR